MSKNVNDSEAKRVSIQLNIEDYQAFKDSAKEINVTVSKLLKDLALKHIEKRRWKNISLF
ncbi:hypothetical protein [Coleofasciculus sp. FACHB-542]|uniref:hypothetical protein n=1 Tax=Coleofasciculus sp. FACHB-542 TaxID=2692787 RepID=UPI001688BDF3|nr:hypothetical protein [Coleofasciculus sp. FACHB-542]MBD2085078.1 hypothetical protein [Coleofasciculus sp. FACHB-542]